MNIGEKIKELRLQKHMKQVDLAEKANISRVAIGNYERGDRQPTVDTLIKIADALDVSLDSLISETTSQKEQDSIADEVNSYYDKLVRFDLYKDNKETFVGEQLLLSELYEKYFFKLLQWRFKNLTSSTEFFNTTIKWLIALQFNNAPILNDADITELTILFNRLFEMKCNEHSYFDYYQKEHGVKGYDLFSKNFLSAKDNLKDGDK